MSNPFINLLCITSLLLCLSVSSFSIQAATQLELQVRTEVPVTVISPGEEGIRWLQEHKEIRVGVWSFSQPPLEMDSAPGLMSGIVADYLGMLQQSLQTRLQIIHYDSFIQALDALRSGNVDLLPAYNKDLSPDPTLIFSNSWFFDHAVVMHKENIPLDSANPLLNKKLSYIGDEGIQRLLAKTYPGAILTPQKYYRAAMASMAYGSTDAFWLNAATADYLSQQGVESHAVMLQAGQSMPLHLAFAVASQNRPLIGLINQFLHAVPQSSLRLIASNWDMDPVYLSHHGMLQFNAEEKEWIAQHKTIKAMLPDFQAPLSFIDDKDQNNGYVLSLLKMIADKTGLNIITRPLPSDKVKAAEFSDADNVLIAGAFRQEGDVTRRYSQNFVVSPWVLVTKRGALLGSTMAELVGQQVLIPTGSGITAEMMASYPLVRFIEVSDLPLALKMLNDHQSYAVVAPQIAADFLISRHYAASLTIAKALDMRPARYALSMNADNVMLQQIINKAINSLSPQLLQRDLAQWQNYQAPAHFNVVHAYGKTLIQLCCVILLLLTIALLRYRHLKRVISQCKEYETKLENQLQFTRTLIDDSPVAIYVRDSESRMVQCNRTYLNFLQTTREQVIGKKLTEFSIMNADEKMRIQQLHKETLNTGEPQFLTISIEVKGKLLSLYTWSLPYRDHKGYVSGIIGGFIDITERDKLLKELQQARDKADLANASKSLFLSQMSHEIRTPMNALIGLLELEHTGKSRPEMRENNISVAYEAAKSLLNLVGDVLDLAKIESGARQISRIPVDLVEVIRKNQTLFANAAADKGLQFKTDVNVLHPVVLFDPMMLNQIISNLLSNAIKFTEKGYIQLSLIESTLPECSGNYELVVRDSGVGLDPLQQQAIFEPFVQIEEQATTQRGTGLGLSICRQLADRLGGSLHVKSVAGKGSAFYFIFNAGSCTLSETRETPVLSERIQQRNILIVDDHKPNRLLLRQQLEYAGHQVTAAEDAESAISYWDAAEPPFDMVLTDCNMPGMDGFELVSLLRKKEKLLGRVASPVFGLTAMAEPEVIERGRAAGMTDCLFKPIDLNSLLKNVRYPISPSVVKSEKLLFSLKALSGFSQLAYRDLRDTLIETNRQDMLQLKKASQSGDISQIRHIVHRLMGSAIMVQAETLIRICEQIKKMTNSVGSPPFIQALEWCESEINRLEIELLSTEPDL